MDQVFLPGTIRDRISVESAIFTLKSKTTAIVS